MKFFKRGVLGCLVVSLFSVLFLAQYPASKASAAEVCSGIGPTTVIPWDSDVLMIGQVGRAKILKDTPLYKVVGGKEVTSRILHKGGVYRVYWAKASLSVGGGYYIHRDASVKYETPSQLKLSQLVCKKQAIDQSNTTIHLNDPKSTVDAKLGSVKRVSPNEYNTNWYTYHNGYRNFYMVTYLNNRVSALFTMDNRLYFHNIHVGSSPADVKANLGTPIKGIQKGNVNYLITNNSEVQTFYQNGYYVTVFFDTYNQNMVTGIQLVSCTIENRKPGRYAVPSSALQQGFESQLMDLLNAARVQHGLAALQWDERARTAARKHSLDMAVNNYFDHVNLKGQDPFQRMRTEGISYRAAGENIAMGYPSSIFAHEAFMDSLDHRENILNPAYTYVGVGVEFQAHTLVPYYTQDYFTP